MNTFLAKKFLEYKLKAKNEHSIHSPFVFDLYCNVIKAQEHYYAFDQLRRIRRQLLSSHAELMVEDLGAGSNHFKDGKRKVKEIARHGITAEKYSRLLFRLVEHFKCGNIVELGTSLGLNSIYLAAPSVNNKVTTLEGSNALCGFAEGLFRENKVRNIEVVQGNFDETLESTLKKISRLDLLFIDGNHRLEPTLHYFESALQKTHSDSLIILDDIYWSEEMTRAWETIRAHERVKLTIDLFQFGLVFFRKEHLEKEHFMLRF